MKQPTLVELVPSFDPPEQWRDEAQAQDLTMEEWAGVKKRVLARDNYTCHFCGFRSRAWMPVDHVDGDPSNNSESNLQTLCYWCHMVKHAGLNCVVRRVLDLYEKPPGLTQVDAIRLTRALRSEGQS